MRLNTKKCGVLIFLLGMSVATAHAKKSSMFSDFEISAAGGVNWLNTDNTHLVVSPFETDSDRVDSTTTDGAWKAGIGYYLFEQKLHQRKFINHLLLELNVYGTSNTIDGKVWQYELPQFYNYDFSAPLSSTRLMLDFKPSLVTWNRFTPYLIVGIGATWNTASYKETALDGIDPSSALSLSDNTQTQLAWDLGAGINVAVTDQVSITAEYIYAFLGNVEPAHGANLLEVPSFSYQIESLLFGLSIKFQ